MPEPKPLLEIENLRVEFRTGAGTVRAVDGVSLAIARGETLAVVGESGSGKSVTAATVMDLVESPPGFVTAGEIRFDGEDVLSLARRQRRALAGARIGMVFQDALVALNPVYTVGWQIAEVLRVHRKLGRQQARERALALLQRVGIAAARQRCNDYPHQLSGGQRQRVLIAMAIALSPELLIADEPTTALDVTVQAQIMDLLAELRADNDMALLLISHDLGVVADIADRVAVMYAGSIIESAPVGRLFDAPAHPYTLGLLQSMPRSDRSDDSLRAIAGSPPDLARVPSGCAFHPRCPIALARCAKDRPQLIDLAPNHRAACHRANEAKHDAG